MPEWPDIQVYRSALERHVVGHPLRRLQLLHPFVLRTVSPPVTDLEDNTIDGISTLGKRLVFEFRRPKHFLVLHLMVAGRLRWKDPGAKPNRKTTLAVLAFDHGHLVLTEVAKKKRASLHIVPDRGALEDLDPGGVDPFSLDGPALKALLQEENHTLKRSLTDPRILSGIGNAYSDEILHRAKLSPLRWTSRLTGDEADRLIDAVHGVLGEWTARLGAEVGDGFPDKVTAFRPEMAVHGRFGKPCPVCGTAVQRIRRAENEVNYCPECQTGGQLLADRSLSRLLRGDWPKSLEALDELKRSRRSDGPSAPPANAPSANPGSPPKDGAPPRDARPKGAKQ
ncbi:MAG: formamidopyrimidine-DNA glycosylase [Myxococcales bacterium]|nr:formamidopyrimidine-DNA glycosylase [Myxococcales bacterium]